jgi:hypothetical protein
MARLHTPLALPFGPRARAIGLVTAAAVVLWAKPMGLLLWARLRILSNIPRTAIADDEALLASRFELPALPTAGTPEVVVLPRAASRNPFVESTQSPAPQPRGSDSPHRPTTEGMLDRSDHAGEGKSTGNSTEENAVEESSAPPRPDRGGQTESAPSEIHPHGQ